MSIPAGESVGLEMHPETDQFLRLDAGQGKAQMGPAPDQLAFEQDVSDGWCVLVPAGTWHNVTNTGEEPMHLYAVYAPVHHARASSSTPARTPYETRSPGPTSHRRGPSTPRSPQPDLHTD